jgi:diguanylate cyclase (GGDEF)-like protein
MLPSMGVDDTSAAPSTDWLAGIQSHLDARGRSQAALLFVDIGRFRAVNESLGFTAGDTVLQAVREAIAGDVGRDGHVWQGLSGDQLTIVATAEEARPVAEAIAGRVLDLLARGLAACGRIHRLTASIGIALSNGGLPGAEGLLRNAESAMHRVKEDGGGSWRVFDDEMRRALTRQHTLERELIDAIERSDLMPHYQPIVSVDSGRIVSVESLVRWQHRTRGLLSAGAFIDVAERTGLILPIGRYVVEQACRQAAEWSRRWPDDPPRVAFNVSPRQMTEPGFVTAVADTLWRTKADARRLVVELTESSFVDALAARAVHGLAELGLDVVIDDFGAGFSSISHIKRLPISGLKVDRSLLAGATERRRDEAILRAVVDLGGELGLHVVVEGVETLDQLGLLREIGCDAVQGFGLWRPAPPTVVGDLLAADRAGVRPPFASAA